MRTPLVCAAALTCLSLLTGCGGSDLCPVSGTVTLKGQNLDQGTITFVSAGGDGAQASVGITNGQYALDEAKGLKPGKYRVSIDSPDGKTPDPSSDAAPGPSGNFSSVNRIPAKYNTASQLEVEVKKGEPNVFNFTIP